jgi:hypothetical protein
MQTFVPYDNVIEIAQCLDYRRLGKQRVETLQILKALQQGGGWSNHPATKMWAGYERGLAWYGNIIILEWIERGYKNNMEPFPNPAPEFPSWWGDERVHSSHRAALLFKAPEHYNQFGWDEKPELNYFWPEGKR